MPAEPEPPFVPPGAESEIRRKYDAALSKFLGKVRENSLVIKRWQPDTSDMRTLRGEDTGRE